MENSTQTTPACKLRELAKTLSDIRVRSKYAMSVDVYSASSPEKTYSSHKSDGAADTSLFKTLAVIGAISLSIAMMACACSHFKH